MPGRRRLASRNALRMGVEVFHALKELLQEQEARAPASATRAASRRRSAPTRPRSTCSWRPSRRAGYRPGEDVFLALDVAASEFAEEGGRYRLRRENVVLTSDEMVATLRGAARPLSDRLDRGRARRGRLGRAGRC